MSALFSTRPDIFATAVLLAAAVYVVCLFGRSLHFHASRFWLGEDADDKPRLGIGAEVVSFLLLPFLAILAFVPALVSLFEVAALEGIAPTTIQGIFVRTGVLIWVLLSAFLLIQVSYLLSLKCIGARLRYCLLLIAVPLAAQLASGLALGYMHVPSSAELARLFHLFSLGVLPFFLPVLHRRLIAPLVRAAQPERSRRAFATAVATIVLVLVSIGIVFGYGHFSQAFARGPGMAYQPAPEIAKGRLS